MASQTNSIRLTARLAGLESEEHEHRVPSFLVWRQDVKWHDGKPFTAADVKCTWDLLLGKLPDKLRLNPRKNGYENLTDVATKGGVC